MSKHAGSWSLAKSFRWVASLHCETDCVFFFLIDKVCQTLTRHSLLIFQFIHWTFTFGYLITPVRLAEKRYLYLTVNHIISMHFSFSFHRYPRYRLHCIQRYVPYPLPAPHPPSPLPTVRSSSSHILNPRTRELQRRCNLRPATATLLSKESTSITGHMRETAATAVILALPSPGTAA